MSYAIPQLTELSLMDLKSSAEYRLTNIMNSLQRLTMEQASVTKEQTTASQAYLSQYDPQDEDAYMIACDYVNSAAFLGKFNAKLAEIQAKEQQLDIQKQQVETRVKMYTNLIESWSKTKDKNIQSFHKYFN